MPPNGPLLEVEVGVSRQRQIDSLGEQLNEITAAWSPEDFQLLISNLVRCPSCGGMKSLGCCEYAEEGLYS
jgi:hypothetical protein